MSEVTYDTLMYNAKPSGLKRQVAFGLPVSALLLGAIILLAAFLRFYNLDAIGNGNTYYTAAVESMLQSWKNFFFVAAEPGGSVTVDKPPVGLWLQALSAAIFGVSGVSVALPQILAGILAVAVVYHLVKRYAGEAAGLIAAFVLAVTPVAIAVERNNTMDATLLLTLLLAAWAFIKATDTGKLGWLLAGAVLVGLGFNIKMMQAFLPVPAFYALYFLGAKQGWWRKVAHLSLATLVLLTVSFSWAIAVDLTPADQRPYVGSSTDNTVTELIFGHNGLNRLFGRRGIGDGGAQPPGNAPAQDGDAFAQGAGITPPAQGNFQTPPSGQPPAQGQNRPPDGGQGGGPGGGGPGGSGEIGDPGLLRLFTAPLSNEIGWLLSFGLLSIAIVAASAPIQLPLNDTHKALVLWGGWLLTAGIFFTVAEFYHAYYLVMLGAPLAALVGMGIMSLWQFRGSRSVVAWLLIGTAVFGTILFQVYTIHQYINAAWWVVLVGLLVLAGLILLTVRLLFKEKLATSLAMGSLVAAMMVTPLVWSALTTLNNSPNISLPSAYSGEQGGQSGGNRSSINVELLDYLQANTQDTEYLMAVKSSMEGASYVIETGRPVLYMGGFNGGDPVVDATDLQQLVDEGRLRFILWGGNQGPGSNSDIGSWLESTCTPVEGVGLSTNDSNQAPGTGPQNQDGPAGRQPGGGGSTLYQCGG